MNSLTTDMRQLFTWTLSKAQMMNQEMLNEADVASAAPVPIILQANIDEYFEGFFCNLRKLVPKSSFVPTP